MTNTVHATQMVEIRKPTLSPSALSEFEVCGRRGQYYLDRTIPRTTGLSQIRGRAWHWMMEHYGRMRMATQYGADGTLLEPGDLLALWGDDWATRLLDIGIGFFDEQVRDELTPVPENAVAEAAAMRAQLGVMLEMWLTSPEFMWLTPGVSITDVEVEVYADLGSEHHQFKGIIDQVVSIKPGAEVTTTVLVDHKTGARAWGGAKAQGDQRHLIQAPLYAEAWLRATGEEVHWVVFDVMTMAGRFDRIWVPVGHEIRDLFRQRWTQTSDLVTMSQRAGLELPTNPSHILCSEKWCSYWEVCPMGANLDRLQGKGEDSE